MRRRAFITLLGRAAAAWPLAARAQQDQRVRRIGVLMGDFPKNAPEARTVVAAFREGWRCLMSAAGEGGQWAVEGECRL